MTGRRGQGVNSVRLGVGVILLALNLRPLIVVVSPLLGIIRADTGLSAAAAGLLTTLPVLCFGALAPLAPKLGRRFGLEPTLLLTMVAIAAGAAARLLRPTAALLAGTVLIGAGVAIANVLIPAVIKRDFAARASTMTGLYTMTLSGGPALAAGVTVPIIQATGLGWRTVLASWGALAVLATVVWLPRTGRRTRLPAGQAEAVEHPVRGLWRNRVTWAVTGYMGLQSLSFYTASSWLPTLLADAGMSRAGAGLMLSLSSLISIAGALLGPTLAGRGVSARALVAVATGCAASALVGLLVAPVGLVYLWMALLGTGFGMALSLAMLFIVQRAPDPRHAAQLSSMAQCLGYLLAATGPFVLGAVHDASGGWVVPLVVLLAILVPQLLCGLAAARNRLVSGPGPTAPSAGSPPAAAAGSPPPPPAASCASPRTAAARCAGAPPPAARPTVAGCARPPRCRRPGRG
jgi:CP family cyanate transporter-like MFS transporter